MSDELKRQLKDKLEELNNYSVRRKLEYGKIESQLDLLYKDIQNGLFGENAKTGLWFTKISSIKANNPKPDIDKLKSEIEELMKQVNIEEIFKS